jgi:hypothetical protein
MGYFDGLTDAVFKEDSSGNTLFYPWGIFGAGFVIDSEEKKNQIRGLIKKIYIVMLPVLIITQATVGFWLNLALFSIFLIWYIFMVKKISKDLPKSKDKLKLSESYKNSAKSHNLPILILLELVSIGFVTAGIWMLQNGKSTVAAYASIGFFSLCSVASGYMVMVKIKDK